MSSIPISSQTARACLNCKAPLHGPFCAQCGQEDVAGPMGVREYLTDGINAHFDWWDGKVPRSLWPLLARPGFLTREFLEGRRVPYLLPSRLYFLVSVVFFFLVERFDPVTVQSFGASGMDAAFAARMNGAIGGLLPLLLLGVVPVFTFGVWVLHLRTHPYYSQHLAFAFHLFTFFFLILTVPVMIGSDAVWNVAMLGFFAYLVLSLRRVYDQGWPAVLLKSVALYGYFLVLLLVYFAFVFLAAAIRSAFG